MESESPICPKTVTVRRNPPRKAKATPATNAPDCTAPSSTSFAASGIRPFPLEEILHCDLPQNPPPNAHSSSERENSENLRIYLRIRPINSLVSSKRRAQIAQVRSRGVSPKKEKKKSKENEVCLFVNNSQSVSLSPPQSMQDSKRAKTEVYDGFSHVFKMEALQREVYETVMDPLVSDFITGKSGMLLALGPTGSGKTHTIFGCPREPGLVPRTIQKLFNCTDGNGSSEMSRSFYISMFEICSERGKGERIIDLSSDGSDLSFQQSIVKGLQEVMVSNATEAEAVIARGMLKRTTAMTNSNSQSSRSQCIMNIRGACKVIDSEVEVQPDNAVLTIVDLAGAEREKKTGNQGTRLLESNFINNTSLVFGLCLRSLLEHQKNPKKPLQKHFQNSLLTRYLRDYLEGKKRMTLILTVKSGSDDYLDTSFLLRQASPYMKIKYNNVLEPILKRPINTFPRVDQPKRRKLGDLGGTTVDERKSARDNRQILGKELLQLEALKVSSSSERSDKVKMNESELLKEYYVELSVVKRNEKVMQKFSRALWNVLKQYKKKLEESEYKVQTLKRSLEEENAQYLELEKELTHAKSCYCSHAKHCAEESSNLEGGKDAQLGVLQLTDHKENNIYESWCSPHEENSLPIEEKGDISEEQHTTEEQGLKMSLKMVSSNLVVDESSLSNKDHKQESYQISKSFTEEKKDVNDSKDLRNVGFQDKSSSDFITETGLVHSDHSQIQGLVGHENCSSMECIIIASQEASSALQIPSKEEARCVNGHNASEGEPDDGSPCRSSNVVKPRRRRLLPASSLLLNEINSLDLEDENEKPKGHKGGRKLASDRVGQTQGSISLLKLLSGIRL